MNRLRYFLMCVALFSIQIAGATPTEETQQTEENRVGPRLDPARKCMPPEYPPSARQARQEGSVVLRFLVDVNGHAIDSAIETTSGYKILDEAAQSALKLCTFIPGSVNGKYEKGWTKLKYTWKISDPSIDGPSAAIAANPNDTNAYLSRGFAWFALNESSKALADFDMALKINDQLAPGYIGRGAVLLKAGDFDKAIEEFNIAIQINPKLDLAYLGRAAVLRLKDDIQHANDDGNTVFRLNPTFAATLKPPGVQVKSEQIDWQPYGRDHHKTKSKEKCSAPEYPSASRRLEETGTVVAAFLIDVDGSVIDSKIVSSSGHELLDEAARTGLEKCSFNPKLIYGIPVISWAPIRYVWKLN